MCGTFPIPVETGVSHQCWYDEIAPLPAFLLHLLHTSSAAIGDRQVETRRWLVSILAVFQRKIDLELVAGKPSH